MQSFSKAYKESLADMLWYPLAFDLPTHGTSGDISSGNGDALYIMWSTWAILNTTEN